MPEFRDFLRAATLAPDEHNLDALLDQIEALHQEIGRHSRAGAHRIGFDAGFHYDDEIAAIDVPSDPLEPDAARRLLGDMFRGCMRPHEPRLAFNVLPSPLLDAVAASTIASLFNVTMIWDFYCGRMMVYEKKLVAWLAGLAGWDADAAGGCSTFGGKATLLYAVKSGVNRCDRRSAASGLDGNAVVVTTSSSHYSLETVCSFLGVGTEQCLRVACDDEERVSLVQLEHALREQLDRGRRIGCIVLSGGSTLDHNIDPVAEVAALRDRLVDEYALGYRPYIHVDSVNGWVWLLFRDHDFSRDSLALDSSAIAVCERARDQIAELRHADSFAADFHKTGLCPYATSFYVCKDATELRSLHRVELDHGRDERFGDAYAHRVTLENSRPANGVVSAWAMLAKLGADGLRRYVAMLMEQGLYLRDRAARRYPEHFEVLNTYANFHATVMLLRFVSPAVGFDELLRDDDARLAHNRIAQAFFRWLDREQPAVAPLIGIVPSYRAERTGKPVTAFLLYPMSPQLDRDRCDRLLDELIAGKQLFVEMFASRPTRVDAAPLPPR